MSREQREEQFQNLGYPKGILPCPYSVQYRFLTSYLKEKEREGNQFLILLKKHKLSTDVFSCQAQSVLQLVDNPSILCQQIAYCLSFGLGIVIFTCFSRWRKLLIKYVSSYKSLYFLISLQMAFLQVKICLKCAHQL